MNDKILLILADGFEELEALAVLDILRRLDFDVTCAGLAAQRVVGAHRISVVADCLFAECAGENFAAVVLPGGMPGAKNLFDSAAVVECVRTTAANGGVVAAICAAPIVLAKAGLLKGKKFTLYPGFEKYLDGLASCEEPAVRDGRVVTGRGPGAVFDFAAALAAALGREEEIRTLYAGMFVHHVV